jgi:putative transposase
MNCPHCSSKDTQKRQEKTHLGYHEYRCRDCGRQFNERTGTVFNFLTHRTEVVVLAVRYYYEFKTSLDDVVKLMVMRGIQLSHQTVYNWTQTVGVEMALKFRARRKGKVGKKWHADATYIRVEGRWCYLYRAIDKEGHLIDVYLSDTRDDAAAKAFFRQCFKTIGVKPQQITTDKEAALANGIEDVFKNDVKHRTSKYMNNRMEQDHRGIKSRLKNMRGFKNIFSALVFCTVFEEIRQHFSMKGQTRAQRRGFLASKIEQFHQIIHCIA